HSSPQSQTSSEDLEEADGRTQEEAMDRPDEDSKPRRSVGRDVEQGAVGAAEEHAGGHDPAQKLEAPPGPDSHGVPSTPLDSRPSARLHNAGSEGPSPGSTRGQRARREHVTEEEAALKTRRCRPRSAELTTLRATVSR